MGSIQQKLMEIAASEIGKPVADIQPDSTFQELGISSLDVMNILFAVEDFYGVELDEAALGAAQTLDQVAELVSAQIGIAKADA